MIALPCYCTSRTTALIAMLLIATCATTSLAKNVTFGINIASNAAAAGDYYRSQTDTVVGLEIWRDWWNAQPVSSRTTQWGETIEVQLHYSNYSDYAKGFTPETLDGLCWAYGNMTLDSTIDYFFAPAAFRGVDVRTCTHTNYGVDLMVSSTDSSHAYFSIPGSFASASTNVQTMTSWLPYLRFARAKTIAILAINDYYYNVELAQGIVDQAAQNQLTIAVNYNNLPFDWGNLYGALEGTFATTWAAAIDDVISLNPDAVVVCDYGAGAEFALARMRDKGWTPKSIAITGPPYRPFTDVTLLPYVVQPSRYHPTAKYPPQPNFTDSAGYRALVLAKTRTVDASPIMAQATLAGMMFTDALVNAASNRTSDVINAMLLSQIQSFMGTTANNVHREQLIPALVTQMTSDGLGVTVVGPAIAAADAFIYPMPTWRERVYAPKWGAKVEIAGTVFIGICLVIGIVWAVFLVYNWNHPIARSASPIFCAIILAGHFVICASLFTWMPNLVNKTTCNLRAWLLPTGLMMVFAPLIAKTLRIYKLFDLSNLKVVPVADSDVFKWTALLIAFPVTLSVLMMIPVPTSIGVKHYVADAIRISYNYDVCTSPTATTVLFSIYAAYVIALLIGGTILAYKIRHVPSQWNESKIIAFCIYNVVFLAVITFVVQLAIGNTSNRYLTFMITCICSLLGGTITVCCLFGFMAWAMVHKPSSSTHSSGNSSGSRSTQLTKSGSKHSHSPSTSARARSHAT